MYTWLIHIEVWQKPAQYCKAIILQLKINQLEKKEKKKFGGKWGGVGEVMKSSIFNSQSPPTVPEMSSNSNTNFQERAGGRHPDGKHNERRQGKDDNQ